MKKLLFFEFFFFFSNTFFLEPKAYKMATLDMKIAIKKRTMILNFS